MSEPSTLSAPPEPAPVAGGELCTFGEPAKRRRHWILKFEDAEMEDMHFEDEREAHRRFQGLALNWNCTLYVTAAPSPPPRPMRTALVEALTPSSETKAAYISEFSFVIDDGRRRVDVPWTTIKDIMAVIRRRVALSRFPGEEASS